MYTFGKYIIKDKKSDDKKGTHRKLKVKQLTKVTPCFLLKKYLSKFEWRYLFLWKNKNCDECNSNKWAQ